MDEISSYSFGSITVRGRTYTSDVIIYPDRVDSSWWRKEGHYLAAEDLEDVVRERPSLLIVGTGASGVMRVPEETVRVLKSMGIEVVARRTAEAVELFNRAPRDRKVVAALHLTC
jgi:hypothetical protein